MSPAAESDVGIAQLEVRRPQGGSSFFRAFTIVLDGNPVGSIRRGEHRSFALQPGNHEIWAEIDWCRSQKLLVSIAAGDTCRLVCRTRLSDLPLALYVITFGRYRYPILERDA